MGIPGAANPLLLASAAVSDYQIQRSLRFNSADSAYLNRTPTSAGTSRRVMTWSLWIKKTTLGATGYIFDSRSTASNNPHIGLMFDGDSIRCDYFDAANYGFVTTSVYRDVGAWFHVVLAVDNTQSTASDRGKLFVNGQAINSFSSYSWTAQNTDLPMNTTAGLFTIGRYNTNEQYFNGYLAEIHFIDGQALTPSSFGETDGNNVWQPKTYTGTYGTNGFRLPFSDNSTAAALGTDTSGNGNNWTPNNLSVTAGSGNDSLVDTPTSYGTDTGIGGEVRGNYCTWNPLNSTATLSNGNLDSTSTSSLQYPSASGTIAIPSSGSYYYELTLGAFSGLYYCCNAGVVSLANSANNAYVGCNSSAGEKGVYLNGILVQDLAAWTTSNVLGVAMNATAGTVQFYRNGSAYGTAVTLTAGTYIPYSNQLNQNIKQQPTQFANFGQRPFAYTAPSGFKALCTQNLPEGTITTSGTFTGNANTNGPFVYLNGVPTAMTINGNAVTFATNADKLSNGFKVRSSSGSYNTSGSNTYSVSTTGSKFKYARAQPNP